MQQQNANIRRIWTKIFRKITYIYSYRFAVSLKGHQSTKEKLVKRARNTLGVSEDWVHDGLFFQAQRGRQSEASLQGAG